MGKYTVLKRDVFFVLILTLSFVGCNTNINKYKTEDDTRIDSLLEFYKDSMLISADVVINALNTLQPEIKDSVSMYSLKMALSELYYGFNIDSAFILNDQTLAFLNRQGDSEKILQLKAKATNVRGIFFTRIDQRDSAIVYLKKTCDILGNATNKNNLHKVYIILADCYQQNGEYSLSGFYYRRALFISDSLGLEDKYYSIFSGLGHLYNELENFELADEYFGKAEKYLNKASDYERYYFANSRGNFYYNTKDYDKALEWFINAYAITNTFTQVAPDAIVEANLGEIYILMNRPDSARLYLDRSRKSWGELYQQPSVKFYVDGLFASLALQENKFDEAEQILLQKYDESAIIPQYIYFHNKRMQELYEMKKDYKKAYQYKTKASLYSDSLRNVKVQNNISEMSFRYQQDTTILKKDLQIAEVEIAASHWRTVAFISISSFVIILLAIGGVYIYRKRTRELKHSKQLTMIKSLRMEIIRNRITPHFTFNVLNVIIPSLDKYKELEQLFRLLIQMLRANLTASDKISTSLENEIDLVKNYLQLYMISNPNRLQINWDISDNIPMETQIPSMSMQIPVENAVKYAFDEDVKDPRIDIRISGKDDEVHIIIEDNGKGFYLSENRNNPRGTGNGLKMLYNTAELLNSRNTRKLVFKIQNINQLQTGGSGTQVLILVPFDYQFDL